jgi:hypothetical protein
MLTLRQLQLLGSIDVLPYQAITANASGKNFTSVTVEQPGGDGAMSVRRMNLPIEFRFHPSQTIAIAISIIMVSSATCSK